MQGSIIAALITVSGAIFVGILTLFLKPLVDDWIAAWKAKGRSNQPPADSSSASNLEADRPPPAASPTVNSVEVAQPTAVTVFNIDNDHHRPIPGDPKSLPLEMECNGKKCCILPARGLMIEWGNNTDKWDWITLRESSFGEVAKLTKVWWLDIGGKIESAKFSPGTTYVVKFVFKLTALSEGLGHPFQEATISVGIFESKKIICLQHPPPEDHLAHEVDEVPHVRDAQWMEVVLGEFFSDDGHQGNVNVRLFAKDATKHRKAGLIVEGIEFRPQDQ